MNQSSILGGTSAPSAADGKDVDSLGPSDTSDSGSDVQGERAMPTDGDNAGEWGSLPVDGASDSDASGTGERASATGRSIRDGADILPDGLTADVLIDDDEGDGDEDDDSGVDDAEEAPRP